MPQGVVVKTPTDASNPLLRNPEARRCLGYLGNGGFRKWSERLKRWVER